MDGSTAQQCHKSVSAPKLILLSTKCECTPCKFYAVRFFVRFCSIFFLLRYFFSILQLSMVVNGVPTNQAFVCSFIHPSIHLASNSGLNTSISYRASQAFK